MKHLKSKHLKSIAILTAAVLMAGCATAPRGAAYVPLVDMKGHSQAEFAKDTAECQAYARQRMDAAQGAVAGALVGALLGAAFAPRAYRGSWAAQGAGAGVLAGSIRANDTQESITMRCLVGRGYNVLN